MTRPAGKVILASRSPRRRELLETLGFDVAVRPPRCDESPRPDEPVRETVLRLARLKAESIAAGRSEVVIAADTLVVRDGVPIGKPGDDAEAAAILASLSGRSHGVVTGFWVRRGLRGAGGVEASEVRFRSLNPTEIEAYVRTGEPRDKAGAYAIQGRGAALVETISGSYSNIVGLPIRSLLAALQELSPRRQ